MELFVRIYKYQVYFYKDNIRMLIEKKIYRRNEKTGDIIKRQEVELKCDVCDRRWTTLYDYVKRKRKLNDIKDYCASCRAKRRELQKNKLNRRKVKSIKVKCLKCYKKFLRSPSKVRKNNFCSLRCRDEYNLNNKYGHLFDTFEKNINEVAYLFGLILGDGHLRKLDQKNTTRICIAFDVKYKDLIETFEKIARKLKINYFIEPKKHSNCQALGFVLPNKLLEKYGMLYGGAKYDNQPSPINDIVNNINFAVGLINSDGWCGYRDKKKKYRIIAFNNTVFSIVKCLDKSLKANNIIHCIYSYKGAMDKRTNSVGKDFWDIRIGNSKIIDKLIKKSDISMKGFK